MSRNTGSRPQSTSKSSGTTYGNRGASPPKSPSPGKNKAERDKEKEMAARAKIEEERAYEYAQGRKFGQTVAKDYASTVNPAISAAQRAAEKFAPDQTFRQYQLGLAQQLQAQARGEGPSLAQMQLAQATDRSLQQALGAARSGLGSNPALAARTAALQASQTMGNAAAESGMLRLREQMQAQQALAGLSGQARGMDIDTAGTRAGLGMDAARLQGSLLGGAAAAGAGIAGDTFNNRFVRETGAMQQAEARKARREAERTKYQDAFTKAVTDAGATYVGNLYKGGVVPEPKNYAKGGFVNGRQDKLRAGDHPQNDVVLAMLSPGEIVVPRSKAKDPKKAAEFAAAIAKRAKKEA